jgi:DNA-binding MarR family transcriptional regulator
MAADGVTEAIEGIIVHGGTLTNRSLSEVHPEIRDLSVSQYRIFALVAASGTGVRVSELARLAATSPQATTRLVQRLEAKGVLVTQRGTLADRRGVVVATTALGSRAWSEMSARRRELISEALSFVPLPDHSAAVLADVAGALEAFVRDGDPAAPPSA